MDANDSQVGTPRIVIVGAGFAGLNVAKNLRRAPVHVSLIDRSNHHLFQPLLYQVATAGLSPADVAVPVRSIFRNFPNTNVLMEEVIGVDTVQKNVRFEGNRSLPFDYLVLATGSVYTYYGNNEWSRFTIGLKTLPDATQIRERLLDSFERAELEQDPERRAALLTFIIVGGGPTGVEIAGAIGELARYTLKKDFRHIDPRLVRILLIEANHRLLPSFDPVLAKAAHRQLAHLGIEVQLDKRVQKLDANGVTFGGSRVNASTMIWAAGIQASPAGQWLQAETDKSGRVKVLADLSVPGHPEIFVIGDAALVIQDGKPLPGVAPVAMQEGHYISSLLKARSTGDSTQWPPFHFHNKGNLATVGRRFAVAEFGKARLQGVVAWWVWVAVHIYYLIGFRNRLLVLFEWAWAYLTFQSGARLIMQSRGRKES